MYGKEGTNDQKVMLTETEKYDKINATFSSVFSSLFSPFYKLKK